VIPYGTRGVATGWTGVDMSTPLLGSHRVTCHPERGDIPAFTQPIKAGTRFSDPRGYKAELT